MQWGILHKTYTKNMDLGKICWEESSLCVYIALVGYHSNNKTLLELPSLDELGQRGARLVMRVQNVSG